MTVKDLIEELKQYPEDAEVKYIDDTGEFPVQLNIDVSCFYSIIQIRGII